jgi:deoxyribodipyrimidine photo-lyase
MIQQERVKPLNPHAVSRGDYVLYWMQASQRAECNHALEFAVQKANEMAKPLVVYFGLMDGYPEANDRHYRFMLEGLREAGEALRRRGIKFVIRHEPPEQGVVDLGSDACLVVADRGYLKLQRAWRRLAAEQLRCAFIQVETDAVVPVEAASPKEEFTAATFRPKIRRKLPLFLLPLEEDQPRIDSTGLDLDSLDLNNVEAVMDRLDIERGVAKAGDLHGGTSDARKRLDAFLSQKLDRYPEQRNDPTADGQSNLSPYLHFGQISPLFTALKVLQTGSPGADTYLEELIVRRELSLNYVFYNQSYDSLEGLPDWTKKTLGAHGRDARGYRYTQEELEEARTHDRYWNAAQNEMRRTGKMQGYMRMYWGKKIIEWTASPREAFRIALYLNNKYELDGRDPNGFAGVAWCFGKHDRPWRERAILGKVRYMNDRGLLRKFDADKYARQWATGKDGDVSGQRAAAPGLRERKTV